MSLASRAGPRPANARTATLTQAAKSQQQGEEGESEFVVNFSTPDLLSKRRNVWQTRAQKGQQTSRRRNKASRNAATATSSLWPFQTTQAKQKPFAVSVFLPSLFPSLTKKKKEEKSCPTFWRVYKTPVHNRAVSSALNEVESEACIRRIWRKRKTAVVSKVLAWYRPRQRDSGTKRGPSQERHAP